MPYGAEVLEFELDKNRLVNVLEPRNIQSSLIGTDSPQIDMSDKTLIRGITTAESIMIIIEASDIAFDYKSVISGLIKLIKSTAIPMSRVQVIITYQPEMSNLIDAIHSHLSEIGAIQHFHSHDPSSSDCIHVGTTTTSGIPLSIRRDFIESDFSISLGTIVPDHIMSGTGNMTILPGISSTESILRYYKKQRTTRGAFDLSNPSCIDRLDSIRLCGLDYAIISIQDYQGNIANVTQGDPISAWTIGLKTAERLAKTILKRKYDITIVSPGKNRDTSLQSCIDALFVGHKVTRQNGKILLVADCSEGLGMPGFSRGVTDYNRIELIGESRENYELGMERAMLFHEILESRDVMILSKHLKEPSKLETYCSLTNHIEESMSFVKGNTSIMSIPEATWIHPIYK